MEPKQGPIAQRWRKGGAAEKKSLQHTPDERLYWRVLREFKALPSEERARNLTEEELLWCALQIELDWEERLSELCPACRTEAMEKRCPVCGTPEGAFSTAAVNENFDATRFEELKRRGAGRIDRLSGEGTDGGENGE